MLAEQFFLNLETIISHATDSEPANYPDGAPKVRSKAKHIPVKLPEVPPATKSLQH
ncbi:hypothetical protein [Bradyrhizobium genosp. P]|uniref:hypothetical protein n=1 Tax=Bradyrhizobium genosp. P TaxID=83641 RepID=UPI003CEB2E93